MSRYSIGIVHDGKRQLLEFGEFLSKEDLEVDLIDNTSSMFQHFEKRVPDLLMLPVDMNSTNGIDLCFQIKNESKTENTFVVLLGSKKEEFTQIAGLESGADDFLYDSIQERVLLSRIRALLKRKKSTLQLAGDKSFRIDYERFLIINNGVEIYFPKKEFDILSLLHTKPSKVFSREEIKNRIWENFEDVRGRTVDVHIKNIREKLGSKMIKTVKGVGYSLELKRG